MTEVLIEEAFRMRRFSYAPYSGFKVGAALLTSEDRIYTGCNIENSSFTPTICAERTAFFKAISDGETKFKAIAIVGGPEDATELDYCPPCGVCRQVMTEFCDPDEFKIILAKSSLEYKTYSLRELMPFGFTNGNLK